MPELADQSCVPCKGGVPPLGAARVKELLKKLPGWKAPAHHHLEHRYKVADFAAALKLVNRIGAMAEKQDHHPDILFGWGYVDVRIWTHKIDGLTESDFVFAAKVDRLA